MQVNFHLHDERDADLAALVRRLGASRRLSERLRQLLRLGLAAEQGGHARDGDDIRALREEVRAVRAALEVLIGAMMRSPSAGDAPASAAGADSDDAPISAAEAKLLRAARLPPGIGRG